MLCAARDQELRSGRVARQPGASRLPRCLQVSLRHRTDCTQREEEDRTNDTVVCSIELFELMESLILAQDERWRRA